MARKQIVILKKKHEMPVRIGQLVLCWLKLTYPTRWIDNSEITAMVFCRSSDDILKEVDVYMAQFIERWYRLYDGPKPIGWELTGYLPQSGAPTF